MCLNSCMYSTVPGTVRKHPPCNTLKLQAPASVTLTFGFRRRSLSLRIQVLLLVLVLLVFKYRMSPLFFNQWIQSSELRLYLYRDWTINKSRFLWRYKIACCKTVKSLKQGCPVPFFDFQTTLHCSNTVIKGDCFSQIVINRMVVLVVGLFCGMDASKSQHFGSLIMFIKMHQLLCRQVIICELSRCGNTTTVTIKLDKTCWWHGPKSVYFRETPLSCFHY